MKKQTAEQLELQEKTMSIGDFMEMLGRQTGPYARVSKLYQIGLEPRYFTYNTATIKALDEGKHISIPISLFKQRQMVANFVSINQLRVITPQFIEDAILQTILHSSFGGYTAAQGRYMLDFSTLPVWFVKTLVNEILNSKNPRITYDWVAPLQELILNHETKPKKKASKLRPGFGTWNPGLSEAAGPAPMRFSDEAASHKDLVRRALKERADRITGRRVTPTIKKEWHDILLKTAHQSSNPQPAIPSAPLGPVPEPHPSAISDPNIQTKSEEPSVTARVEEFLWDNDNYIDDGGGDLPHFKD